MDLKERPFVYGLVAACIAGIVLVGLLLIFVGGVFFSGEGFSEVFFLDSQKLPTVIEAGHPLDFSFMVGSHYNKKIDYRYTVLFGDTIVQSGAFSLPNDDLSQRNRYNKTVSITNLLLKSTLTKVSNASITETQATYNGGLGLLIPQDGKNGSVNQMVSDPPNLYYPVKLPLANDPSTLIFNPKNTETFHTVTSTKTIIGNLRDPGTPGAVEIEGTRISGTGYDEALTEWTIQNNHGIITASSKTYTDKFRYAFDRVAVEVKASPANDPNTVTPYEIHFWVIVTEKPLGLDD